MIKPAISIRGKITSPVQVEGKVNTTTIEVFPELENVEITPTLEDQKIMPQKYGFKEVNVKGVSAYIDEDIQPEYIREGVEILGVVGNYKGVDTSDATVTTEDVLEGKTIYINNEKAIGTMSNNGGLLYAPSEEEQSIPKGYTSGGKILAADITQLSEYDKCLLLANSIENIGDYSDTTATAEDILEGKTAYSNGERIVGTMPINSNNATLNVEYIKNYGSVFGRIIAYSIKTIDTDVIQEIVSTYPSINEMFQGLGNLEEIPMVDTSNVIDMYALCTYCSSLKVFPAWNTSKVTRLNMAFMSCGLLHTVGQLDGSSLTNTDRIFTFCYELINCGGIKNLGKSYTIKSANYSEYTLDMAESSKLTHESSMNIINGLYDLNLTYDVANGGTLYTQKLIFNTDAKARLTPDEIAIATNKRLDSNIERRAI